MRVSVVGAGYVGLISGVCLAEKGHNVICIDIDDKKVNKINNSIPSIYEEGLDELLKANIGERFQATTNMQNAVKNSDITLIAVGTPYNDNKIDLRFIRQVSGEIGEILSEKDTYHVVIVKSTVVPGTTNDVVIPLLEQNSGKKAGVDFGVGMNPEFLREGVAINDFMKPDRIVLGGIDDQTHSIMSKLYEPFKKIDILKTNNNTAEMIKYVSNSLLATLISFSNEIGNLCASINGVDIVEVMKGVHLDERLSPINKEGNRITPGIISYLEAGCGFGGSCFPKDVNAIISFGEGNGKNMQLLKSVININNNQPNEVIQLLEKHYPKINGLNIAIFGLAFKPGTDDMRESPAIPIINRLASNGAIVRAFDPVAEEQARILFNHINIIYCNSLETTLKNVDVVVLLTSWPEFQEIPKMLESLDINPIIIDGRRMLSKDSVPYYEGIGV